MGAALIRPFSRSSPKRCAWLLARKAWTRRPPAASRRWRASARTSSGLGKARPAARSRFWRSDKARAMARKCRPDSVARFAKSSDRTGTAHSAAAVGVGQRLSAAKSMSVVSVSWPTAEINGMALAAAARTTISSLKPQRSSRLPPPRATMITSGRGIGPPIAMALKPAIAAATSAALVSPWTRTGQTRTRRGKRSLKRCSMSRITAPVGEVTTPITRWKEGDRLLAGGIE